MPRGRTVARRGHIDFNMKSARLAKNITRIEENRVKLKSTAEQRRDIYRNLRAIYLNAAKQYEELAKLEGLEEQERVA